MNSYVTLKMLSISLLFHSTISYSQQLGADSCHKKDLVDWIRQWFHMQPKTETKNSAFFIAPVFGSTPSTGGIFGITAQTAFYMPESKLSAFQANIQYTTKNQVLIFLRNTVYTNKNKMLLSGDWRYFSYSEPTYGLGTNAPIGSLPYYFHFNGEAEPTDSLTQPMNYNYFKFHQVVSFRIGSNIYAGAGIHLDLYSKIDDKKLDTANKYLTSHYGYSKLHGFNPTGYSLVGLSANFVYDSRDNLVNPYRGLYGNLNFRINPTFLGSDQNSSSIWLEFRSFKSLSVNKEGWVWANWFIGNFTVSGVSPYLALPALGYDQRTKSGRGYTTGRYRGEQMMYAETELRFPISKCTRTLGGVIFLNAVTTNNKEANIQLFDYVQPGYGIGLRILFNKETRMNIQLDYGASPHSSGIYFGASEVF